MRIAMWSGPRNLSTAMMYAFGNRDDFAAWDEPFYAAYLARSGQKHPMREVILAESECDPQKIAERCIGAIPNGKPHFYMKHMPHHMLEGMPLDWAKDCVNIHLIRHPARVVASYSAKRSDLSLDDIGFRQQHAFFKQFPGPVLDTVDIRNDPEAVLRRLCDKISLAFDPAMLSWQAGPKPFDGPWAPHWYGAVHHSTGFAEPEGSLPKLESYEQSLVDASIEFYDDLKRQTI